MRGAPQSGFRRILHAVHCQWPQARVVESLCASLSKITCSVDARQLDNSCSPAQVEQVFANLKIAVEAADGMMADIFKLNYFLTAEVDQADVPKMRPIIGCARIVAGDWIGHAPMIPPIRAAVKPLDLVTTRCRPPYPTLSPLSVCGPAARPGRRSVDPMTPKLSRYANRFGALTDTLPPCPRLRSNRTCR